MLTNYQIQKLHKKYRELIPEPGFCPICGTKSKLEMTNDNHCYEDNIEFWKWKCRSCHRKYDVEYGLVIYRKYGFDHE